MAIDDQGTFNLLMGVVRQAQRDAKRGDAEAQAMLAYLRGDSTPDAPASVAPDAAQWLAELDPRGDELGQRLGFNPAMLRAQRAAQPSGRDKRRRDFADRVGVDYRYLPDDFDTEG